MADKKEKKSFFSSIKDFFSFKEVRSEAKKVVWPSKQQIINNTIVVIVVAVGLGIFIFGLDTILTFVLVDLVFQTI